MAGELPTMPPWEWVCANVVFDEPEIKGPFNPIGREYMREIINNIDDNSVRDETLCMGTGNGKTLTMMSKTAWAFANDQFRGLWVMPSLEGAGGATEFNNTRLMKMVEAMPCFQALIPTRSARHNFAGAWLRFGGNILNFVGSNAPGQVGANRCRIVVKDEMDKFKSFLVVDKDTGEYREAGAAYLADERTKQVPRAHRIGCSSPTTESGPIWKALMSSDLRRRWLPCPHCNGSVSGGIENPKGWIVLVKDSQYHVLPSKLSDGKLIPTASLLWDKESTRKDGTTDVDRLVRSSRFECPHCGGHIRDENRVWMDQNGIWIPTFANVANHRGYQLASFYAPWTGRDFDSSWGGMAKKFKDALDRGEIGGYINSDLAEVNVKQDKGSIEIVSNKNFAQQDWTALMSCDFQKLWPFLWFVVQKFSSFKLQPPLEFENGQPKGFESFPIPLKAQCMAIVGDVKEAWQPLAEILRFDPCTGDFPPLAWMAGNGLTGAALVDLFKVTYQSNGIDLGRHIFKMMGQHVPKGGDSEVVAAGHCELSGDDIWQELRDVQAEFHVGESFARAAVSPNRAVLIDSGYAENHNPEVVRKCFESGFNGRWQYYDPVSKQFGPFQVHASCLPAPLDCWIPYKGYPVRKRWRESGIERATHFAAADPFYGMAEAKRYSIELLEAASEWYFLRWMEKRNRQKAIQAAISDGKTYVGNLWSVAADLKLFGSQCRRISDFEAQMNSKGVDKDGNIWERGSGGAGKRRFPDHLNDCCRNMEPLAEVHGFYSYEAIKENEK